MEKIEYCVRVFVFDNKKETDQQVEKLLNHWGRYGWELCDYLVKNDEMHIAIFKRKIQ